MLARKGTYPGFEGTYRSELRNPLVELPMSAEEVLAGVDAVIVTHTHLDHWDDAAQQMLPKDLPLFVQNESDAQLIRGQGFRDVRILEDQAAFGGVTLSRTGGQHGTDTMFATPELAEFLGVAIGVVFEAPGHKTLYLAGDTIWPTWMPSTTWAKAARSCEPMSRKKASRSASRFQRMGRC